MSMFDDLTPLEILLRRPAWHADAACREHVELPWVPEFGVPATAIRAAKAVCAGCLVRQECSQYALALGPELVGIWAGTTNGDRKAMRREAA